jgi:hypothetical protein
LTAELMALAEKRNIKPFTTTLLKLEKPLECVWLPYRTYGGSFRCWRKTVDGAPKMVIGLNISGQRKQTPEGQLDVWLPGPSIAAVTGTSVEEVWQALRPLPVYLKENVDWVVRIKTESDAEMVVRVLSDYFRAHAGSSADEVDQPPPA